MADVTEPVVETVSGKVRGVVGRRGVHSFRGIPFAAPPVGRRRWRPPEPVQPWADVRDARTFGAGAPQTDSIVGQLLGGTGGATTDEATCLTLNVWTPAPDGARRPVMVWLHGGAFVMGTGAVPWYSGTNLAARGDCVVVTLNYRLGALGFLHLADLGGEQFTGSGNAGLLDQVAALRWVQENVAAFGGDPGNVTVFGESAGGMSISTHLGLPASRGLFHRAVPQSGATNFVYERDAGTAVAREVLGYLGVDPDRPADAQDVPVALVLEAQDRAVLSHFTRPGLSLPFQPVVDGDVLPEHPLEAVLRGDSADVALLTGTTAEEIKLFLAFDPRVQELGEEGVTQRTHEILADDHDADELVAAYRRRLGAGADVFEVLSAVLTDHVFRVPAIRLAEAHSAHQPATYMYLFQWKSPAFGGRLGSAHAVELPFVWDNLDMGGTEFLVGDVTPEMRVMSDAMAESWVRFARSGDPGHPGLPEWPAYEARRRATMVFDTDGCEVLDDPFGEERRLFRTAAPAPR